MSEFQRLTSVDFIAEYKRLLAEQTRAISAGDTEGIEMADHELKMFLMANAQGRLAEWLASRKANSK